MTCALCDRPAAFAVEWAGARVWLCGACGDDFGPWCSWRWLEARAPRVVVPGSPR